MTRKCPYIIVVHNLQPSYVTRSLIKAKITSTPNKDKIDESNIDEN